MKNVKSLALLAVAASAVMAFAATASADVLTSPTGTVYTGTIKAQSEGHAILHFAPGKLECASSFEAIVTEHGSGKTVKLDVPLLSFTGCTNGWHTTTVAGGTMSIHGVAGSYNGDVFSSGVTVESTNPGLGNITCRFATSNTTIGTFTGGTPATIHIQGSIPFHSGSVFCGSGAIPWTGSYKVTSPQTLLVDTT